MKSMKCDTCDATFEAEDFEDWMEQMKEHYSDAHQDIMKAEDTGSMMENMQKMNTWMKTMKAKWELVKEA